LRMRAASNPGGLGHEWVRARFIDNDDPARAFIPARLTDNPHLDQESYTESLERLDAVTRAQLLDGDWTVLPAGTLFQRDWFSFLESLPGSGCAVRYWDKAATEGGGARSAGVRIRKTGEGSYVIEDVMAGQWSALKRERMMRATAEADGPSVAIWVEQEPGSGGKESAEASVRNLAGYSVHVDRVTGSKIERAQPFAAQAEAGNVRLLRGAWNQRYLEELCAFPLGPFADQVDASSGAFNMLSRSGFGWTVEEIEAYGQDKIVMPDGRWVTPSEYLQRRMSV